MRKLSLFLVCSLALAAFAGSRAKDSFGAVPTLATDGVSLTDVTGCRASVRVADAGSINGGTLVPYYYDATLGTWTQGPAVLNCALTAFDGGAKESQICPDQEVLARFGRVAIVSSGLIRADGGSPNGIGVDAGRNVAPVIRIECWGQSIL